MLHHFCSNWQQGGAAASLRHRASPQLRLHARSQIGFTPVCHRCAVSPRVATVTFADTFVILHQNVQLDEDCCCRGGCIYCTHTCRYWVFTHKEAFDAHSFHHHDFREVKSSEVSEGKNSPDSRHCRYTVAAGAQQSDTREPTGPTAGSIQERKKPRWKRLENDLSALHQGLFISLKHFDLSVKAHMGFRLCCSAWLMLTSVPFSSH